MTTKRRERAAWIRGSRAVLAVLVGGVLLAAGAVHAAGPRRSDSLRPETSVAGLVTARAMGRALAGGRSGEAAVSYLLVNPMGGSPQTIRGRVRVESPDRVRLDFTTTGEKIGLRGDGGEWLQPATRQLIRIPADRASAALAWWRVLLPGSGASFREESLGDRRYRLEPATDAGGVTVTVRLDAAGFPAELAVEGMGDAPLTYRLSGWHFGPARGAAAYRITAPAGYETVELP